MFQTETDFIGWLQKRAPQKRPGLKLGIGDDAAVASLASGRDLILKSDMCIENVHFSFRLHSPRAVGYRALARALSDVAAMGGTPRFALLSLALPERAKRDWFEGFYEGFGAIADRYGVGLAGGDTARVSACVYIDVSVIGEISQGRALARSGARPGDQIYVSGRLGNSALGLRLLQARTSLRPLQAELWPGVRVRHPSRGKGLRAARVSAIEEAIQRHLYPEPRCSLGVFLADRRLASAMIDLSDGLSTDLNHLCRSSGVGALIWGRLIPRPELSEDNSSVLLLPPKSRPPSTASLGRGQAWGHTLSSYSLAVQSLELALHGGEDYELLFTVPTRKVAQVPGSFGGLRLTRIGEICRSRKVRLVDVDGRQLPFRPSGYDHFRKT
jgi:thiamine-monophosphate kinase